jgi:hypothetical protein
MQVQLLRIRLRAGTEERMRAFLDSLPGRAETAVALREEGIAIESVGWCDAGGSVDLFLYQRAADLRAASAAFTRSTNAVDVEMKRLIAETWASVEAIPIVFDHAAD